MYYNVWQSTDSPRLRAQRRRAGGWQIEMMIYFGSNAVDGRRTTTNENIRRRYRHGRVPHSNSNRIGPLWLEINDSQSARRADGQTSTTPNRPQTDRSNVKESQPRKSKLELQVASRDSPICIKLI